MQLKRPLPWAAKSSTFCCIAAIIGKNRSNAGFFGGDIVTVPLQSNVLERAGKLALVATGLTWLGGTRHRMSDNACRRRRRRLVNSNAGMPVCPIFDV